MTETKQIHILLVDDHALFRESVSMVLGADSRYRVDHCASIRDALTKLEQGSFELVLLDHDLGTERASQFLPAARERGFNGRVLVVTAWISDNEARRLLRQGVAGIFLKHGPVNELSQAIDTVTAGAAWLDPSFSGIHNEEESAQAAPPVFNDRQRKVLRYIVEGLSNKEIAWHLQISESYVKAILQGLFQKTGVRTRGQLVRVALEQYEDQL